MLRGGGRSLHKASGESGSIRVATEKVDNIINLVGELLITQSMLSGFADGIDPNDLNRLRQGLTQLARNTRELQESVMQIRMLPISFAFQSLSAHRARSVRKLGKKVELKLIGEAPNSTRRCWKKSTIRWCIWCATRLDHGLETPEQRLARASRRPARSNWGPFHEGGNIIIEVRDDGAGLNKAKILQKARERALIPPDQELNDEQIDNLIFMPAFPRRSKSAKCPAAASAWTWCGGISTTWEVTCRSPPRKASAARFASGCR